MTPNAAAVDAYWAAARRRVGPATLVEVAGVQAAGAQPPPAWSFGASAADADELLALVPAGTKTGTASALASFEAEGEPLPRVGDLSIILDGRGEPRALIVTTEVSVCPFEQVDAKHATAEGEGDLARALARRALALLHRPTGHGGPGVHGKLRRRAGAATPPRPLTRSRKAGHR